MNDLEGDAAPTAGATPAVIRSTVDPQQDRREIVLRVNDLRKRYGANEVVRGLSFEIRRGDCFGLLGPNGAGKTTTLRCCLGLIDPDGGTIEMVGQPVPKAAREARIRVGVVPQMDNLDPDFTVTENLRIYGGYFSLPRAVVDARIPRLLEFAGLASKGSAGIRTLSGGMKRRLTLARALINDPELLILDEPTTGLDPQARHLIWDGLRQLLAQGKTILLTTHFMDEAERLASRLAVIDHGALIASDTPRGLLTQHVEPEVVEVYGDEAKKWADVHGRRLSARLEIAGETAFCYANDAQPLLADLATRAGVRYLHRPANLEDLFIKLTGRELRD
ncbi:MAG: ATP-binding cassette domain-containing protein [Betaproteobacteria bacterium]|nr:ATP-binding cassette domain-containing protein [Betaproteobacteria bacterium]